MALEPLGLQLTEPAAEVSLLGKQRSPPRWRRRIRGGRETHRKPLGRRHKAGWLPAGKRHERRQACRTSRLWTSEARGRSLMLFAVFGGKREVGSYRSQVRSVVLLTLRPRDGVYRHVNGPSRRPRILSRSAPREHLPTAGDLPALMRRRSPGDTGSLPGGADIRDLPFDRLERVADSYGTRPAGRGVRNDRRRASVLRRWEEEMRHRLSHDR
jgi:hypothetical protein